MQNVSLQAHKTEAFVTIVVISWGLLTFYLGYKKSFTNLPRPFFGLTVAVILIVLISLYLKSTSLQEYCDRIPLKTIALFHSWRIIAGWIFIENSDILPRTFTNNSAYGDIVAGFLGLSILIFGGTKRNYLLFNVFGLIDLMLAVGTGITLTIMGDDRMENMVYLPLIMIPLFGVPISAYTHIISLIRLVKARNINMNDIIT